MTAMAQRIDQLWPELMVLTGAVICALIGLSRQRSMRAAVPIVAMVTLAAAVLIEWMRPNSGSESGLLFPSLGHYVKIAIGILGIGLAAIGAGHMDRKFEAQIALGRVSFDPLRVVRGEYHAFFLFSIAGVMLVCGASDLIWLFLALELVSLPTYIMVALGRSNRAAQEAGIKYFFLGALATAIFLYGFALLYGATGSLDLIVIRDWLSVQSALGGLSSMAVLGLLLSTLGICFKITAVPMHFYAPDVYEGASTPVTAFLSIVPKFAGMCALIMLLGTVGWNGHSITASDGVRIAYSGLPQPVTAVLWMVAVLTMTLGNLGGILQKSIKRTLAYSSISHSGYMLIGVLAGPGAGFDALFFYLFAYGLMNCAAFSALASVERRGNDVDSFDDISGLRAKQPLAAGVLAISAGSLLGLPPFLGFFAKAYLFMAALEAGHVGLVVIACVNSAISAFYYLRFVLVPLVAPPSARADELAASNSAFPRIAAAVCGALLLLLSAFVTQMLGAASRASSGYTPVAVGDSAQDSVQSARAPAGGDANQVVVDSSTRHP
ncbi:MAG: NADH-quinone oxidoreductase subunit N [Phycisphaerales bacterium]|nr:NADH-quinone oxidoreductase subunit N [Phycisphaerales bacterium]